MDFSPLFMSLVPLAMLPTTGPVGLFDRASLCITRSESPSSAGFLLPWSPQQDLCHQISVDPFAIEIPGCAANEAEAQQGEEWGEFQNCLSSAFAIPRTHGLAHPQYREKV